jgi:hypothetical protein
MQCSKIAAYSITSLAPASRLCGTVEAEHFGGREIDRQPVLSGLVFDAALGVTETWRD